MDEVIFADFQLLFDDNAAERHLDTVRWVASACLMISTLLLGTFPLSLRTMYSEEWILKTFGKPARPTTRTVITSAMICACAGVLISLVFVCLLPGVTAYPSENQSKSQLGVDTSMGFIMTFVLQELIFLRFGNSDKDYINQYHIYIVQFIRCELNVWKTLPVEPKRPSEELQEQEELAAEIIEMRQLRGESEDLDLSATEAFMISMNTDDAPGRSRLGSYFARKQAYMKIRYPKMTFMVYFGATFLALHSIFDGICMALQPTIEQTWFVFGNLLIHRVLIAVITTMELMSSNFRSSEIAVVVFIISIMPSLGSVFGTLVARSAAKPQTLAQLLSVSAGSLLYVTFFELYRGDKREYIIGPFQCMSTFIGFLLSTFAYILATRSHRI